MKRIILIFGLIAGLIVSVLMPISIYNCYKHNNYEASMVIGFTGMIIAFSFIFVAIKNYRDKYNEGLISFGKAFKIGILITLVASTLYVIVWLFIYYNYFPDFMDRYAAHEIGSIKAKGMPIAETNAKIADLNSMKENYKNPVFVILYTYMEIFPIGLLVTLICALILKRKNKKIELSASPS